MKKTITAFLFLLALPLSQAHAFRYECVGDRDALLHLGVHTIPAEGPADLEAVLTRGRVGPVILSGSSVPDPATKAYALTDGQGNPASLLLALTRLVPARCGRAGCDNPVNPAAHATLVYKGQELAFTCN